MLLYTTPVPIARVAVRSIKSLGAFQASGCYHTICYVVKLWSTDAAIAYKG